MFHDEKPGAETKGWGGKWRTCGEGSLQKQPRVLGPSDVANGFKRKSHLDLYKYIQRDATVSCLLFQELYMFRDFTTPCIGSRWYNIKFI
jgi:hypothetical protein